MSPLPLAENSIFSPKQMSGDVSSFNPTHKPSQYTSAPGDETSLHDGAVDFVYDAN